MSVLTTTTNPQTASPAQTSELNGIYDLGVLVDRCMGDASLAAKLLDRFGERLPITVAEVQRALTAGDRSEVLKQAHTLKGEAGSLAAVRLQQAAAELEACVRNAQDMKDPQIVSLALALADAADQCRKRWPNAIDALTKSTNHA